jgi:NAD+ kinase
MKKLHLVTSAERKPEHAEAMREALPWLRRVARLTGVDFHVRKSLHRAHADLLLVFGGDGTMLSVARSLAGNPIPVLGINLGQLGFLAEVDYHDLKEALPQVLVDQFILSPRMMLRAHTLSRSGKRGPAGIALNDAVLLRLPKATLMTVGVSVSGEEVAHYRGDGLIVSTATGSTAYSLSAGGPILSERLKGFIVVPICAHTLANRPIVLSGDETIEMTAQTRPGESAELVLDGQVSHHLAGGTRIIVERAPFEFNLATLGRKGRYEIIRDKLHWAGWVKENR